MTEIPDRSDESGAGGDPRKPYERPEIVWEEEYKPTAFGVSCALQPGNPGCNPGPLTS